MEEVVVVPPVLVPALVPQRVECPLIGEVAALSPQLARGCRIRDYLTLVSLKRLSFLASFCQIAALFYEEQSWNC
jgi:hypothetical protein